MHETKTGKSPGPDDLPSEFFLNLGERAKQTLLAFYNITWKLYVPAEWKKATIIPLLKTQKPTENPSSYRPISLTNCCCKLMERMITNRLNFYLEDINFISDFQAGFRRKRSTIEQAAFFSQCIKDGFHRKQSTLAVFVDFKNAYDKVWHKKLVEKLIKAGIGGNMLKWFRSFISQRIARVKYQSSFSKYVHLQNGLPQGAVSSCILFNIMINDIIVKLSKLPNIKCLAYADDIVIYATGNDISALNHSINDALKALKDWCQENLMIVNLEKTVCQLFTLSTKQFQINVNYNNQTLNQVDAFRYLGVFLDSKLIWKKHSEEMAKKGNGRLRLLKRLSGITWGSSTNTLLTTYKTYVKPVLEYGGELIATASNSCHRLVDLTQNKALRLITGAAGSTPIAAMEIQTGLEPLRIRREKQLVKLREKCRRLNLQHWQDYTTAIVRLKTHKSFLSCADQINNLYNFPSPQPHPFIAGLSPPSCRTPSFSLSVGLSGKKCDTVPEALRAFSLEVITATYPRDQWLHIYTDGSASDGNTGAGVYCEGLFEKSYAVGFNASNFDAEIYAINVAVSDLLNLDTTLRKAVFLIDSQAAILATVSPTTSDCFLVEEVKANFSHAITAGWRIVLQWIPSHCNILGNERADVLAKNGSKLQQPVFPLSFHQFYTQVKRAMGGALQREYTEVSKEKIWKDLLLSPVPMDLPRAIFVANFRIATGHDFLYGHLHRIGVVSNSNCPLCNSDEFMNFLHLTKCFALTSFMDFTPDNFSKAKFYWAARRLMADNVLAN